MLFNMTPHIYYHFAHLNISFNSIAVSFIFSIFLSLCSSFHLISIRIYHKNQIEQIKSFSFLQLLPLFSIGHKSIEIRWIRFGVSCTTVKTATAFVQQLDSIWLFTDACFFLSIFLNQFFFVLLFSDVCNFQMSVRRCVPHFITGEHTYTRFIFITWA